MVSFGVFIFIFLQALNKGLCVSTLFSTFYLHIQNCGFFVKYQKSEHDKSHGSHLLRTDRELLYMNILFLNSTAYFLLLFPFQLLYTLTNYMQSLFSLL